MPVGAMVLVETSRAGAPFPHCGAAHGASGGPRAPPETNFVARFGLWFIAPGRVDKPSHPIDF